MSDLGLRAAYVANVLILTPVCFALLRSESGMAQVFEGKATGGPALRLLLGSLWAGVLIASILGLISPGRFVGVLVFQVIYKSVFLAAFVLPALWTTGPAAIPAGVSAVFAAIVLIYPWVIWRAWI